MTALQTDSFGSSSNLYLNSSVPLPLVNNPNDVLIKVNAASINPIDVRMLEGYGSSTIDILRRLENCPTKKSSKFPLTLGRDFSGEIIYLGGAVKKFKIGDKVWGAIGVQRPGTHAEYITASACSISLKPKSIDDVGAASIPYVALTTWMALCRFGQTCESDFKGLRVLVLGGSGGIGTFAIQLLKAWGSEVTTTCSSDATNLLAQLGAHNVLDYKRDDFKDEMRQLSGFDFILDTVGSKNDDEILSLLKPSITSKLVTLNPPFLKNTDKHGFLGGLALSTLEATYDSLKFLRNGGKNVRWAFFSPDGKVLRKISNMVENQQILPIIEKKVEFENALEGYTHVAQGHSRGKTVLNIASKP